MSYQKQLGRLYAIGMLGMKLGLRNMQLLDAKLGNPSKRFPAVHIAGTNGKGSVSTKIAHALKLSGLKVGLYTSPHLATFRERIQIDGAMIGEEETSKLLDSLFSLLDRSGITATFFELTTLLAFLAFAQHQVDIAVLEVGLGGRLDATNIIVPKLSIITSISLDHTQLLGNTIEEIACEKAGIIKRGIPLLVGPRTPLEPIRSMALQQLSPYYRVDESFELFDQENRAIAKRALELLNVPLASILAGLHALPPCRLERVFYKNQEIILDVAHNPDGLLHLFKALKKLYPGVSFSIICGFSQDKDLTSCLEIIAKAASSIYLTQAENSRAAEADTLKKILLQDSFPEEQIRIEKNVPSAVIQALREAKNTGHLLVICGSFFIMEAARRVLGFDEPRDPLILYEHLKKF